ncbi:MAG: hypothetical protein V1847_04765 [Candidatus Diapherotrites archaeon]
MHCQFQNIDFKKAENRIDVTALLPFSTGKGQAKTALFVKDQNFAAQSKDKVSRVILEEEISKFDKKAANSLAEEFDAFFAEGPVMLTVARYLGQVFAPKGKMPVPVQPEISALEHALRNMKSGVRLTNKKGKFMPLVQCLVGKEFMPDEELAENCLAVYQAMANAVSNPEYNIKNVYLKFTMGPPIKVGEKTDAQKEKAKTDKSIRAGMIVKKKEPPAPQAEKVEKEAEEKVAKPKAKKEEVEKPKAKHEEAKSPHSKKVKE